MKRDIWVIVGCTILITTLLIVVLQKCISGSSTMSPPLDLGTVRPLSTSASQPPSPTLALDTTTVLMPTVSPTARLVTSSIVIPTSTSTATPTFTCTLSPEQAEERLRSLDAHIAALDLLVQTTPPKEIDTGGDTRIDRRDYDLGQAGYVVITSRERDDYFDLAHYDLDGDGDFDAVKHDLDHRPGFEVILYDLDDDCQVDLARFDVNLDGAFKAGEIYCVDTGRWRSIGGDAVPPPLQVPLILPIPFFYP